MEGRENVQHDNLKNEPFGKGFYTMTAVLGLVLLAFEMLIYRRTIINPYIPFSIMLVVGSVAFYFNRQHYKKTYLLTGNFLPFVQHFISWGSLSCYIFMATNYYLADKKTTEYKFSIKEKNSMSGPKGHRDERQPLVTIDYFSFEKELVFRYVDTDKVNKADSVTVVVRKGGLGFDILDNYGVFN
jgi:hypothetical protein